MNYRASYLITNESGNGYILHSNKILNIGEVFIFDGDEWTVEEIIKDMDR